MDKCKKCYRYDPTGQTECAVCDFKETYIERSKIDNAIEEIEDFRCGTCNPNKRMILIKDVVEILKRNIGE